MESPYSVSAALLEHVASALRDAEADPVTHQFVSAGAVVHDAPNQLSVGQAGRVFRSVVFPVEARGEELCYSGSIVIPIAVVLTRCGPTLDDQGRAPTPDVLDRAHERVYRDAAVIWNALTGDLPHEWWERANVTQELVGSLGALLAIDTRVMIGVDAEAWCP